MGCTNKCCITHRLIDYSLVTIKWEPPRCGRKRKRRSVTCEIECLDNVTYSMFDFSQKKLSTRSVSMRLCGYLTYFERHVKSWAQHKNPIPYGAYDADYYNIFGLCNAPLHFLPQRGCRTKKTCFLKYHSGALFGLARSDSTFLWEN